LVAGAIIAGFSALIILNFGTLFGWVITISTRYSQPALGIMTCIFAGWLWQRDALLQELKKNDADAEQRLFWKIWPLYVKWLCPVIIGVILAQSVL
jgi:NSS family neurotransmitter:Na+ symporter